MKCPIDHSELIMTERHGVEIDYCPKCRGVWLDRGELDKIIEKASGPLIQDEPDLAPPPPPRSADPRAQDPRMWQEPYREPPRQEDRSSRRDYDDDDRRYGKSRDWDDDRRYSGKRHKRKSILAEIFDVFD